MSDDPASLLCTACGLCCDGTLFGRVEVAPREVGRLGALGFAVDGDRDTAGFAQPCPQLEGRCCGVYPERPSKCASFRCGQLRALEDGTTTLAAALETVAAALAARDRLPPAVATVGPRLARRRAAADWRGAADAGARASEARLYLELVAFDRFLDRHFRNHPVTDFGDVRH